MNIDFLNQMQRVASDAVRRSCEAGLHLAQNTHDQRQRIVDEISTCQQEVMQAVADAQMDMVRIFTEGASANVEAARDMADRQAGEMRQAAQRASRGGQDNAATVHQQMRGA